MTDATALPTSISLTTDCLRRSQTETDEEPLAADASQVPFSENESDATAPLDEKVTAFSLFATVYS